MKNYAIIDLEILEKRIEELLQDNKELAYSDEANPYSLGVIAGKIQQLRETLSQSTPLIPVIEQAIDFGKDIRSEKSYINENFGSPFIDYEDSTKETTDYISNLKLNIQ